MKVETTAKNYATRYHQGQYRKNKVDPYIVHPENVARFTKSYFSCDEKTLAIAWLHDILEDTSLDYKEIKEVFGFEVAKGVYLLTRNVGPEEYKERLRKAPDNVKMVKLCDTLDNVRTLGNLSKNGIRRKVEDCNGFYIPMAKNMCSEIAGRMEAYIRPFS